MDLEKVELRSEEVQEILTCMPVWIIRYGNIVFLAILILLIAISYFIKYPDVVTSEALITTEIPPQKEFAKVTGKLDNIFVSNNQEIQPDQVLAVIENGATYDHVRQLELILDSMDLTAENLYYPVDEVSLFNLGGIESEYALFENSYINYRVNRDLKPYFPDEFATNISLNELNNRLITLQHQEKINQKEVEVKKRGLDRHTQLFKRGIISQHEYEAKQLEYFTAERVFKNNSASISQIRESIGEAQRQSGSLSINSEKDQMILRKKVVQHYHQLRNSINNWKLNYVLKSNIKGKVSFLNYWNANQTVQQGDLVFTVLPAESSSLIAKLITPPQNSGKIKKGQRVNINLKNYPEIEFGFLQGKVKSISNLPNQEGFYLINVAIPQELTTNYGIKIKFSQEMAGTADIIVEDLRLVERILYQLKNVFNS